MNKKAMESELDPRLDLKVDCFTLQAVFSKAVTGTSNASLSFIIRRYLKVETHSELSHGHTSYLGDVQYLH